MTRLHELLLERIQARGPISFAEYMSLCLYHPEHGYYGAGAKRTGWQGDFVTSPELGPAFGRLWAKGFEQIWEACSRSDTFDVVEVGPGEGSFAAAVLSSASGTFSESLRYTLVERAPAVEARQRARLRSFEKVRWSKSLRAVPAVTAGCVFANEILDNVPVHLVRSSGGEVVEVLVGVREGRLVFTTGPLRPDLRAYLSRRPALDEGQVTEVAPEVESLVAEAASIVKLGAVIFIDYGYEDNAHRPSRRGGVVAYSSSGVDEDVLERPGEKDLTVHVDWARVARALSSEGLEIVGPIPQRSVLDALGIKELDRQLQAGYDRAVSEGRGADALRCLSTRHAVRVLTDPAGLGRLQVLMGLAGISGSQFSRLTKQKTGRSAGL